MSKPSRVNAVTESKPGLNELSELFAALEQVGKVSFEACLQVKQLVGGGDAGLFKDIANFRLVTAPGTGHVTLELRVRDLFRERATALIAAYL